MNILQIDFIGEVSIGTLNNIYDIYKQEGDRVVYCRMLDYAYNSFIETLWKEPELSLRNLLI